MWLINQYASTPETGMGGRQYYLAKELVKKGYRVYLFASLYTHLLREPKKINNKYLIEEVEPGFSFVWLSSVNYTEANDKKRVLNWFKFAYELAKVRMIISEAPDIIMYSSPSVIPYLSALYLSKVFKVKLIWDIRDLWPLTLIELGGTSKYHPFILLHQMIEIIACKKSDFITSNWPLAINYLEKYGAKKSKFKWIPNGFFKDEFEEYENLPDIISSQIPKDKFIVGYTGTLGQANSLQTLLDAALLSVNDTSLHYLIVGRGRLREDINDFISEYQLDNITLLDAIPKKYIPSMLKHLDVCYVGFNKSKIYDYGSSLNKLPEYLMSGNPIIYCIDSPFKPVSDANAGLTVPAENPPAVLEAIYQLKSMSVQERYELGVNGYNAAINTYEYGVLADQLIDIMFSSSYEK